MPPPARWLRGPVAGRVLVAGTCAAAALLLVGSMQRGWALANDFQWSGARMLLHGTDPYQVLFERGRTAFALTQYPNYSPLLYVLLLPLGMLSLGQAMPVWALLNLFMFLGAAWLVAGAVGLRGAKALLLLACFVSSEAFMTAVGMGQQTAVALLAAVLGLRLTRESAAGAALGVMLVKYSFLPVLLVPLLRKRWKTLVVAALLELAGVVAFCAVSGSGVLEVALDPLRAARMTQGPGAGDVPTLARLLGWSDPVAFGLAGLCGVLLTWVARHALRSADWVDALAVASLISLVTLPHLIHDYCFLLPVAASASRLPRRPQAVLLTVVGVLWLNWMAGHALAKPYVVSGVATTLGLLLVAFVALVRSLANRAGRAARGALGAPLSAVVTPTGGS